jgi:hypothetical protein
LGEDYEDGDDEERRSGRLIQSGIMTAKRPKEMSG